MEKKKIVIFKVFLLYPGPCAEKTYKEREGERDNNLDYAHPIIYISTLGKYLIKTPIRPTQVDQS